MALQGGAHSKDSTVGTRLLEAVVLMTGRLTPASAPNVAAGEGVGREERWCEVPTDDSVFRRNKPIYSQGASLVGQEP